MIVGKELTLYQQIEKEISIILKKEPKTSTIEHNELVTYLENALRDAGYNDLAKVDIFKYAVRDPLTKEMIVPFETHPVKTDDCRNMAWQKSHQDALKHKDDMAYLKNININQSSAVGNKSNFNVSIHEYLSTPF